MPKTIEKELFIKASPGRVFQVLAEKEELEHWFVQKAEVDLRPGGAIRLEWAPGAVEVGNILALEPSHRLSYSWKALSPSPTTITFELTQENNGTSLHLAHSDIGEGEGWENYYTTLDSGWDVHLKNLLAWLETGTSETPGATGSLHKERA
ncbi:MAG TPA: SRPBCC domain-containing protein [Ktedonobacteraceae bacterium]|nr:SRPBCC domain-containing protein [Ktedonobacteraceae bacterium]